MPAPCGLVRAAANLLARRGGADHRSSFEGHGRFESYEIGKAPHTVDRAGRERGQLARVEPSRRDELAAAGGTPRLSVRLPDRAALDQLELTLAR
jgi:hypothetical protein